MLPIPRRKSEEAAHEDDDSKSHRHIGCKKWEEKLIADPKCAIFESRDWAQKRNGGTEICILPTFSQKRIFADWILEIDCRLMKFGQWPIIEASDQMVEMLEMSGNTQDRDSWGFDLSEVE